MFRQPTTRQELYDRIRESSKNEVILEEMIRLGFWPADQSMGEGPGDEIRRQADLQRQLRALLTEQSRLQNAEALKQALRKQRLEESRRKRLENKQQKLQQRQGRAAAWRARKQQEIVYLGDGVSEGLSQHQLDREKLQQAGLPVLADAQELATAIGTTVGELRFLAFARQVATTTHYQRFRLRKKTGGFRLISAPMPRLKRTQEWILHQLLEPVAVHEAAHGFRRGRSIVSNAQPHVGADVVVNVDLKDFFPTITYPRVRGMFRKLGYSEALATLLALICTEPEVDDIQLDGRTYYVARGERFLPQGAPTSPAITNIICRGLDGRLTNSAAQLGFVYTRYADDITFSGSGDAAANVGQALRRIRYTIDGEGFQVHPDKTRIFRRSRRQEVTGLVVNQRVNISRKKLRNFRATLYQIQRDGPVGKRWGNSDDVIASIEGFANYVAMVDSEKGAKFQAQVRAIIASHGRGSGRVRAERQRWVPRKPEPVGTTDDIVTAEVVDPAYGWTDVQHVGVVQKPLPAKKKPWWKFW